MSEEETLILKCQHGDKQAFGILVQKYMKQAYFIALGLTGSHENALDLSQEAFIRAYRSIKKMDSKRKFFTWYYQILRNLCFNFLRDRTRQAASFSGIDQDQLEMLADHSQDVQKSVEQNELQELLWKTINMLKPEEREIIILKDFQEMKYKDISETLNCPIGTVMSRLYNARKALKAKMEGYYHE